VATVKVHSEFADNFAVCAVNSSAALLVPVGDDGETVNVVVPHPCVVGAAGLEIVANGITKFTVSPVSMSAFSEKEKTTDVKASTSLFMKIKFFAVKPVANSSVDSVTYVEMLVALARDTATNRSFAFALCAAELVVIPDEMKRVQYVPTGRSEPVAVNLSVASAAPEFCTPTTKPVEEHPVAVTPGGASVKSGRTMVTKSFTSMIAFSENAYDNVAVVTNVTG
jgi:hypothetical protein